MSHDIYEKEYFHDDYSTQFGEMRDRYRARTQSALKSRTVDQAPVPNATTVVFMEDTPEGGVTITTGDFVRYFNERCGHDRLGAMRHSIQEAQRRSELKTTREKVASMRKKMSKKSTAKTEKRAPERRHSHMRFPFVRVVFGMMLILSIGMLFVTSALLDNVKGQVMELENEITSMQAESMSYENDATNVSQDLESVTLSGEDSVEIYTPEEEPSAVSVLLNALASLGKK